MERVKSIILTLFIGISSLIMAQPPGPDEDNGPVKDWIKTKRIGFFTDRLSLTPAEAEKFWPVYNAYRTEIDDLRKQRNKNRKQTMLKLEELDDKTIEDELNEEFNFRQKELDIEKKYLAEWKKVLPMKKVALLLKTENDFKIWILKEWKKNGLGPGRSDSGPTGPPGGPPPGN